MDCIGYREAISARIDGEDAVLEGAAVDGHGATCAACHSWADAAIAVTRSTRVGLADSVPDLTSDIMAAIDRAGRRGGLSIGRPTRISTRERVTRRAPVASPGLVARLGLFMVALAQLCVAAPALLGSDAGAPIHVAHEQGSWSLALAVGLLVVVARPRRAAAMLPLVGALAGGLAFTMVVDIAAGRTQAAAEAPHGLAFLGLGMLWLLAHDARWAEADAVTADATGRTGAGKSRLARAA